MGSGVRKLALTAHVVVSVGWLGAVACALALAVAALASDHDATVRGTYVTIELIGRYVLVPLSIATLVTGVVLSLGTSWGLFRHYWVVFKLLIAGVATLVLLMYMQTLEHLSETATTATGPVADAAILDSPTVVLHSSAALVLLLVATTLAICKPKGVTRFGRRRMRARD